VVKRLLPGVLILLLLFVATGCTKKRTPPPQPLPAPPPQALIEADARFDAGDWPAAAQLYQSVISEYPELSQPRLDRIHFRLGLIYANPDSSLWDPAQAQELLSPFAQTAGSEYQPEASILVTLLQQLSKVEGQYTSTQRELRRVSDELNKIKEIDRARRRDQQP
jgi:hypothetical protein